MVVHFHEILFYVLIGAHIFLLAPVVWKVITYSMPSPSGIQPRVTVIVCAHNEAHHLPHLIPALLAQKYLQLEIILVLDRCTDASQKIVSTFSDPRLQTIAIEEVPHGIHPKKHGISQAIHKAAGEWVLLTDADCLPASDEWVNSFAIHMHKDVELILGAGAYYHNGTAIGALTGYETFQTAIHYFAAALSGNAYMGVGRNIAYKKEAFLASKGFAPHENVLGGDDDLLVQKLSTPSNTVVNFGHQSLTYSYPKRTLKGYLKQKTRHFSVGKHYQPQIKRNHMIRMSLHALVWLSWLYLICIFPAPERIIVLFGLLVLVKGLFFKKIAYKTGLPFQLRWFLLLDFCYAILLPLIGIRARFERTTRWK